MTESNETKKKIYYLTATFNRQSLTHKSVFQITKQKGFNDFDSEIWVVEAGDSQKTTDLLAPIPGKNINVINVPESTFWTSAMSIGIDQIATVAKPTDIIICFNNDIMLPDEIVEDIIEKITNDNHLVISPLSVSPHDGRVIATGVKVKNWYLGINETPFKEQKFDKISASDLIEVDYLTQRFMAFQARLIFEAGNYNCKWLPHYGGDYEFTFRAKKSGYNVVIDPAKKVHIDETATGLNSKYRKLTLSQRLNSLFSIRSNNNIWKTMKFSLLTAPVKAQPLNLFALVAKSLILALLARPR